MNFTNGPSNYWTAENSQDRQTNQIRHPWNSSVTFAGWRSDILLHHLGHVVIEYNCVQRPALVSSGDLLTHRRQKTLWVEESSHPEHIRSTFEQPAAELRMTIK